jgi:hypothetical protein
MFCYCSSIVVLCGVFCSGGQNCNEVNSDLKITFQSECIGILLFISLLITFVFQVSLDSRGFALISVDTWQN